MLSKTYSKSVPVTHYGRDPAKELRSDVSGLLEFKNVILETFPHLQSRISGNSPHVSSSLSSSIECGSSKIPDASGVDLFWRQDSSPKIRKSPDDSCSSNISDSGFGTDPKDSSSNPASQLFAQRLETREDPGCHRKLSIHDDELWKLLDAIHLKTTQNKSQIKTPAGQEPRMSPYSLKKESTLSPHHQSAYLRKEARLKEYIAQLESKLYELSESKDTKDSSGIVHSVQIQTCPSSSAPVNIKVEPPPSVSVVNLNGATEYRSKPGLSVIGPKDRINLSKGLPITIGRRLKRNAKSSPSAKRNAVRRILQINDVVELKRELLTSIMSNEMYKSQLEQLTTIWETDMKDNEQKSERLRAHLNKLQAENDALKTQILRRDLEIEEAKSIYKIPSMGGMSIGSGDNCLSQSAIMRPLPYDYSIGLRAESNETLKKSLELAVYGHSGEAQKDEFIHADNFGISKKRIPNGRTSRISDQIYETKIKNHLESSAGSGRFGLETRRWSPLYQDESNMGLEEMIQKSHILPQEDSLESFLQSEVNQIQPDSLLDEDSSIEPRPVVGETPKSQRPKRGGPYLDSYSSSASVLTTSQEEEESFEEARTFFRDTNEEGIVKPKENIGMSLSTKLPLAEKFRKKILGLS